MGNSSSSSKRSSASDAGNNLLWSLEQLAAWEEKLCEDESFLTEQLTRKSLSQRSDIAGANIDDNAELQKQRDQGQFNQRQAFDQSNIRQEPLIQLEQQREFAGQPVGTQATFQSTDQPVSSDRTTITTSVAHSPAYTRPTSEIVPRASVTPATNANIGKTDVVDSNLTPGYDQSGYARTTGVAPSFDSSSTYGTQSALSGYAVQPLSQPVRPDAVPVVATTNWESKNISPSGKIRIPVLQGVQDTYVAPEIPSERRADTFAPSFARATDTTPATISTAPVIGTSPTPNIVTDKGATAGIASTSPIESMQFDEELFLPQKFHFAYQALQTLVAGAERNFCLSCRANLLRQHANSQSQPLLKQADEKKLENINSLLNVGLAAWDNAVAAVQWLQKDYDLGLRWVKLSRALREIQAEREALFASRPSFETNLTDEEARRARYASDSNIRARSDTLMSQINDVRKKLNDIMKDIVNHQRDSLSIGLMFLDKNMSGAIEPEDIPNLQSDLFAALDINGKHKITTAHLQGTVDKMLNDVVSIEKQLKDLEISIARDKEEEQQRLIQLQGSGSNKDLNNLQKFQANILNKQEQYSFLYAELQRKRLILDRLYQVFGQSFIRQVLKKLDTPTDEIVERVQQLMASKRQEERGVTSNFAVNRTWQPAVDV